MSAFDWDHLRAFVAVARCGKLTRAAQSLHTDHTTVARRITALEHALQTKLFDRSPAGYALTEDGARLLPIANQMETLADMAGETVGGAAKAIAGSVRIACPEGIGSYFLAPRLIKLADRNHGLNIQIVTGTGGYSLSKREADIVIALSCPGEGRIIARKLCDYDLCLYASRAYLDAHGVIGQHADLVGHQFVGYVGDLLQMQELDYLDQVRDGAAPRLESTNLLVQVKATIAGGGLCVLPVFIARNEPELVPVLPGDFCLTRSFWLMVHADYRNQARVRLATRYIQEEIRKNEALFRVAPRREDGALGGERRRLRIAQTGAVEARLLDG